MILFTSLHTLSFINIVLMETRNLQTPCSGIGGDKCDECAVGHVQTYQAIGPDHEVHTRYIPANEMPTCTPCGECFDNWERILQG